MSSSSRRVLAAFLTIGSVAFAAWFFLGRELSSHPVGSPAVTKASEVGGDGPVPLRDSSRSSLAGTRQQASGSKGTAFDTTRLEFQQATNLLDFLQRAILKPGSGGRYYVDQVSRVCDQLPPNLSDALMERKAGGAVIPKAAEEALGRAMSRCSAYHQQHSTIVFQMAGLRDERQGVDPLLRFSDKLYKALGRKDLTVQEYQRIFEEGKALGDPYIMADLLTVGAYQLLNSIDPHAFNSDESQNVAVAAAGAVRCELKSSCLWGDEVLLQCALRSECEHPDARDMWRSTLAPEQHALLDRAIAILRQQAGLGS